LCDYPCSPQGSFSKPTQHPQVVVVQGLSAADASEALEKDLLLATPCSASDSSLMDTEGNVSFLLLARRSGKVAHSHP